MHVSELFPIEALRREVEAGYVYETHHPELPLRILSYAPPVLYEGRWNAVTLRCRGLVLGEKDEIVALPFERFFNLGDPQGPPVPEGEPYRIFEKLDGSLGITFEHAERWHVATRGSFTSEQARKGAELLGGRAGALRPELTYLFEIIYPAGQIVVPYEGERLALLTAFSRETGAEHLSERERLSKAFDLCPEHALSDLAASDPAALDLATLRAQDREGKEGYVVCFESGLRVKIKHPTYVELHRLVTSAGPRWVWARLCVEDLSERGLSPREIESQAGLSRADAETIQAGPPLSELTRRLPQKRLQEEVRAAESKLLADFAREEEHILSEARRLAVGNPRSDPADRKATALRYRDSDVDMGLLFRALLGGADSLAPLLWKRLRPSGGEGAFEGGF